MNYEVIAGNARKELKRYLVDSQRKSLVLGVSGGVDSATVGALAYPVCRELNIPLVGRSLPIESNKPDECERAKEMGEAVCQRFEVSDLSEEYNACVQSKATRDPSILENSLKGKIRRGNIKARIRMIELYDIAGASEGIVLSTDNYTELLLGFWTLHGDVGDIGMIQNLWKTEVYALAEYLRDEMDAVGMNSTAMHRCIEATPTDGLGITNSDLEQIGARTYKEVDQVLKAYLDGGDRRIEAVVERHTRSQHKRNNPYNFTRELLLKNVV